MRLYSTLFEEGIGNTINLLSCALTIVNINDVFIPKIKYDFISFLIKYDICDVHIEHRIGLMEIQYSKMSLEEFVYSIKRHVLAEYFRIYENRNKLMWKAVQDEIKQNVIYDTLKACTKLAGDTHE
jgi:hypothetical protein